MLSIAIPSRNEKFLRNTILDVLANATGKIEIFPILDGYEPPEEEIVHDDRVKYLRIPLGDGKNHKRQGINLMVSVCKGEYVMWCDGHCSFQKGFDEILISDSKPDRVQVPKRNRLDAENWCVQEQQDGRPSIDYEYIQYPPKFQDTGFHGFKWDTRTIARKDIIIDDIITCQGSCFFMEKEWFKKCGFMDVRYQGWGQEAEEVCFTTWCLGGEVKVNKRTQYLHLHKGKKYGRFYHLSQSDNRKSYEYCYDFWMNNRLKDRVHDFDWLIDKFMPMPGWSLDWKKEMNYNKSNENNPQ